MTLTSLFFPRSATLGPEGHQSLYCVQKEKMLPVEQPIFPDGYLPRAMPQQVWMLYIPYNKIILDKHDKHTIQ